MSHKVTQTEIEVAEYFATTAQFCICQPLELQLDSRSFIVAHWWDKKLQIEFLNEHFIIKQCVLCGLIARTPAIKVIRGGKL